MVIAAPGSANGRAPRSRPPCRSSARRTFSSRSATRACEHDLERPHLPGARWQRCRAPARLRPAPSRGAAPGWQPGPRTSRARAPDRPAAATGSGTPGPGAGRRRSGGRPSARATGPSCNSSTLLLHGAQVFGQHLPLLVEHALALFQRDFQRRVRVVPHQLTSSLAIDLQQRQRLGNVGRTVRRLAQELLDVRLQPQRAVDLRIRARDVGADVDQVARLLIGKHRVADHAARRQVLRRRQRAEQPADALQHVDGGVVVLLAPASRDSTMCPSRMLRTVSAIGSCMSSPSASTV